MSRSLRIGLSPRLMHKVPAELGFRGKTLQYLEQSIAHWVMAHGALAFMLPTLVERGTVSRSAIRISDYVSELDGLILQGGLDVSPLSYREEPRCPEWRGDPIRDSYEIELFWECVIQDKPVLGICRGCQLINVALGGTLWQDLPTQYPGVAAHQDSVLYDELAHSIQLAPTSLLRKIYQDAEHGSVTSIHHQAIKDLGKDLTADAYSIPDRIIEAIHWEGSGFVIGVQWHPEFHSPERTNLLAREPLMERFLDEARLRVLRKIG